MKETGHCFKFSFFLAIFSYFPFYRGCVPGVRLLQVGYSRILQNPYFPNTPTISLITLNKGIGFTVVYQFSCFIHVPRNKGRYFFP